MTHADVIKILLESKAISRWAYLALSGKHTDNVCRLIAYNGLGLLVKENRHLYTQQRRLLSSFRLRTRRTSCS